MSTTTAQPTADERYSQWKSLVPVLYDWLAHHNLIWPSLSCRWGPRLEQGTYKTRQRLYLSEQTDGSLPNTLVVANCEIVKPRVAAAEHICQFNEEARSPFVKKLKTIIHPGEVNRIREIPQNTNIIATHTDSPDVYVWDVLEQPNRQYTRGSSASKPDLILTGHRENAEFALSACSSEPYIASGGKDNLVVVWSVQDYMSSLASSPEAVESPGSQSKGATKVFESESKPSLGPRGIFHGHTDNVEDVQFSPSSSHELCSVGDDLCLILWDSRTSEPSVKVEKAHDADLHSVDWNQHNTNLILTGSADNRVHIFDRRKINANGIGCPVHKLKGHRSAVLCVQWCPHKSSVFGSSAEDGLLNIWDFEKVGKKAETSADVKLPSGPAELLFRHAGHRDRVVDFHWNGEDPWTIASVSDDCVSSGGGGTLQIWRMLDLIYRPEEEVLVELDSYHLSF